MCITGFSDMDKGARVSSALMVPVGSQLVLLVLRLPNAISVILYSLHAAVPDRLHLHWLVELMLLAGFAWIHWKTLGVALDCGVDSLI